MYIDAFLKQHGRRQTDPSKAIMTTSGQGYLAKSKAFKATVSHLNYRIQKTNIDYFNDQLSDLFTDHVHATITIDSGGELSGSFNLQKVAKLNGDDIYTAAADSSLFNGIVERPH